jgi:aspartate aminotransferase
MPIADAIAQAMERSSWIRAMFEEGARRKAQFGAENVFDFSLGNPDVAPPDQVLDTLARLATDRSPGRHAYMANAGLPEVRDKVAAYLKAETGLPFTGGDIVMSVGAGGALNSILKAIVNPGQEVIVPAPYFVEYDAYLANHGGTVKRVKTNDDFSLDAGAIAEAVTPATCAVLINSPNNPTGKVYDQANLEQLFAVLEGASTKLGRAIYLLSDEPYRQIAFEGVTVPWTFQYPHSIVGTSFSKDLSLPGQRIGYVAVHPQADDHDSLIGAITLTTRILGYVNAPALFQRLVAEHLGDHVDVARYQDRRDLLCEGLAKAGYEFTMPQGAFYLFPKSPVPDDVEFVRALQAENILVVPGSGFFGPGHFRIAYCVPEDTITRSMAGFAKVRKQF